MTDSKSSCGNKKLFAVAGTLAGLGASTFINFYCQRQNPNLTNEDKRRKKWICDSNVDESPRPIQTTPEVTPVWEVVDESITTASGNASIYPSPSPAPTS